LKCRGNGSIIPVCSMYRNPYLIRFKQKAEPLPIEGMKKTTGLTGLNVVQNPHRALTVAYARILRALEKIPIESSYRQNTEKIVQYRLNIVQEEKDVEKLEERIGMGQVEELIEQAEFELLAARAMIESRGWEPLVEQAPLGQWKWPVA